MTPVRRWTRERIVAALLAWFATYGETPVSGDWSLTYLQRCDDPERLARYRRLSEAGLIPTRSTVHKMFGGWNAALAAAGLEPRDWRRGSARCSKGHDDWVMYGARRHCRTCKNAAMRRWRATKSRGLLLGPPEPR